jgi:hypothetical protein
MMMYKMPWKEKQSPKTKSEQQLSWLVHHHPRNQSIPYKVVDQSSWMLRHGN